MLNDPRTSRVLRFRTYTSGEPATYKNLCSASGENATDLACRGRLLSAPTNCSATNFPSGVNTSTRLFPRSATYASPSLEIFISCGNANCWYVDHIPHTMGHNSFGLEGATAGRWSISSGLLPYAPHIRLNFPVSASYTIMRLFPYPSLTKTSLVLGYTRTLVPPLRTSVALLPVWPLLPMAITNLPSLVNLSTWLSFGRLAGLFILPSALPRIQTKPLLSTVMLCSLDGH